MLIDRYTKCVLTVIAVCLVWISLGGPSLWPVARAQSTVPAEVVVSGWKDTNGVVWSLPAFISRPSGTFAAEAERLRFEALHQQGMRMPVMTQ